MGELLRRYWMPIGGASELDTNPIKPMRLMGEDLVLYRDQGGRFGLLDRHCPHRRADLSYGFVEETGIRCNYHGWLMDETGRCIEQPYDDIGNPYWTVGRLALWPNGFYLGNHFEWRVPVDDENTLSVAWFFMRVPKGREPYVQDSVPTWVSPIKDENGRWITSHVINQDIIAWVGQGRIADPTKENIGQS